MQVCVLAGGIGAARFLRGLVQAVDDPSSITVVGNTGDDIRLFGLQICPDLDAVMYTLGGGISKQRGWGREDETFTVLEELRAYGAKPEWFGLGDRDLATHIVRTQMLDAGYPLSWVTTALCHRWNPGVNLLPMSDDRVETHVIVDDPGGDGTPVAWHFQEWWVRYRAEIPAREFVMIGANTAKPAAGVLDALAAADAVVLAPSNPIVSIGPILAISDINAAVRASPVPVVGVSPIIGGAPVRGMADACLSAVGVDVTATGVAAHYGARSEGGVLDGWLIDTVDADQIEAIRELGIACAATNTLMETTDIARGVAASVLALASELA